MRKYLFGVFGGMLVMGWLFFLDRLSAQAGYFGFDDPRIMAEVMSRSRRQILYQVGVIFAVCLAAGGVFGLFGAIIRSIKDSEKSGKSVGYVFWGGVSALCLHGYFLARSVIVYPQLYVEHFYYKGGVRRAAMVFFTDNFSPFFLDVTLVFLVIALVSALFFAKHGRNTPAVTAGKLIATAAAIRKRPKLCIVLTGGLVSGLLAYCLVFRRPAPVPRLDRPNVLLIGVDSLRPDRVYGPDAAERFPAIGRVALQGVRFKEAHVTIARTFPALVTLLTGRFPHNHGIRHMFPSKKARSAVGDALPAMLATAGWKTGVVSDFAGEIFTRIPLGFQDVDAPRLDLFSIVREQTVKRTLTVLPYTTGFFGRLLFPVMRGAAEFTDPMIPAKAAVKMIDKMSNAPFFLTVFFSTPHSPFAAPYPHYKRFTDSGYRGLYKYTKQPLPMLGSVPEKDARQVNALYDGAVYAVDRAVAFLLDHLERRNLHENTIVVLFSDHGENLFDVAGRGQNHGDHLLGSLANRIPFVIMDPRKNYAPRDVPGIVRDVDLTPTLLSLLGFSSTGFDGVDLSPLLRGDKDTLGLHAYSETGLWFLPSGPGFGPNERLPYPSVFKVTMADSDGDIFLAPEWEGIVQTAKHRAIRTDRWKLLYRPTPGTVRYSLFDVEKDRDELVNVAVDQPEVVSDLRALLEKWMTADGHTRMQGDLAVTGSNPRSGDYAR